MAEEDVSKRMQVLVTFAIGGIVSIGLWPYLETVSKGLIVLFAPVSYTHLTLPTKA